MLKLVVPLSVSINELYVNEFKWNPVTRKRAPTGRRVMSAEGERVKKLIQDAARRQMVEQEWDYEYTKDHHIYMDAFIYFNRKGRDDNNIYKLNNDSLEKIVYDNDSRVLTRTQMIRYDKKNPRVELTFSPVEYIGIFENQNTYEEFVRVCEGCTRHKRNCSILHAAVEGFIQDEIQDGSCSSFKPIKNNK